MATAAVARSGTLKSWIQPPASSKRKRDDDVVLSSLDEALFSEDTLTNRPAKKRPTKPTTKPKTAATTRPTTKPTNTSKEAKKLYTETLKAVEKRYIDLDKKVKVMSPNSHAITVSNYATSAAKHLKTAKKLADMGETMLACNFVMALGDASHRRISSFKTSGDFGDCDEQFARLDEALLPLIEKRERPATHLKELPEVPHMWTREDADVGEIKTNYGPNQQQRGQMDRQSIDWEKKRREARRVRRETCGDWIAVALSDLVGDRDYLKSHGIGETFHYDRNQRKPNSYFRESIARLEQLVSERE